MDKFYKLKDVKKGQRLRFFFDYNFLPILGIIAFLVVAVLIVKGVFFPQKSDFKVLISNSGSDMNASGFVYDLQCELELYLGDISGDKKVKSDISYAQINDDTYKTDPEYYGGMIQKLASEMEMPNSVILIGDETTFGYYIEENIAAKKDELKPFGYKEGGNDIVKIPFSKIKCLKNLKSEDELFLGIRSPELIDMNNKSQKENYEFNIKAFLKLIK